MVDRVATPCLIAAMTVLAACTSQTKLRETEFAELIQWLPGHYDNTAQAQQDMQQGVQPPHEKLALAIVSIDAPRIGRNVFYLQEMAADDPRRVMSQKVLAFEVKDRSILETVWLMAEPRRWRDGHLDPDLFRSLVLQDLQSLRGCDLTWKKTAGRFVGENDPKHCSGSAHTAEGSARVELRAELGADTLSTAELSYDTSDNLLRGRRDDPFYRFRKQPP